MPRISTHIGIAFYAMNGLSYQSAIVLSTHQRFDSTVLCGTVIETVNGRVVQWQECDKSPATYEPYLKLVGVITVAEVDYPLSQIFESIRSLEWKAQDVRASSDTLKEPYSADYVRQVLLDLCNKRVINLQPYEKDHLDGCISEALFKLLKNDASRFNLYPIISFMRDGDPVFGRTKY